MYHQRGGLRLQETPWWNDWCSLKLNDALSLVWIIRKQRLKAALSSAYVTCSRPGLLKALTAFQNCWIDWLSQEYWLASLGSSSSKRAAFQIKSSDGSFWNKCRQKRPRVWNAMWWRKIDWYHHLEIFCMFMSAFFSILQRCTNLRKIGILEIENLACYSRADCVDDGIKAAAK